MCLLGVLAERPRSFAKWLGPDCLARLSRAQLDGWGVSVFARDRTWSSQRFVGSAAGHGVFTSMTSDIIALVAQGQMRSVGDAALSRTPPFRRGRWVFAHTGAIEDVGFLRSRTSQERQRQCGALASEMLFAFLLSRLDASDLTERHAPELVDSAMASASRELGQGLLGSSTFVLSDGDTLYAHRCGRPVHILEYETGHREPSAVVVASSASTDGRWVALDEGTLLRCRRGATLDIRILAGPDPRRQEVSDIELPFTD
jgi:predicted glutamine amidotransferase